MLKKITLKNYRTHKNTTIELNDIVLIIGSNNSGKSNFLSGISYFSSLISRANPANKKNKGVNGSNFFPHKHILSENSVPIVFNCEWVRNSTIINYEIQIYCENERVGCKENLIIAGDIEYKQDHGFSSFSSELMLRSKLEKSNLQFNQIIKDFFRDLAFIYYYNFQPSLLKGTAFASRRLPDGNVIPVERKDFEGLEHVTLAKELGREGENLQELIKYIKKNDEETYGRFSGYLRRFEDSFNGIVLDEDKTKWQFDMGNSKFPYFDSDKISDGLVKAAAVALLCAMKRPPSIIMIEEVENGINQRNISEFINWLIVSSEGCLKTQFIITSHSPSVIREFSTKINQVYNVHLKKKKGYISTVTNLNDAIKPLVDFGTIKEEAVSEVNGIIQISAHELTELFYNGILGEL